MVEYYLIEKKVKEKPPSRLERLLNRLGGGAPTHEIKIGGINGPNLDLEKIATDEMPIPEVEIYFPSNIKEQEARKIISEMIKTAERKATQPSLTLYLMILSTSIISGLYLYELLRDWRLSLIGLSACYYALTRGIIGQERKNLPEYFCSLKQELDKVPFKPYFA